MTGRVTVSLLLILFAPGGVGVLARQDENATKRRKQPANEAAKPTPAPAPPRRSSERRTTTANTPKSAPKRNGEPPRAPAPAELTVATIPADSTVFVNGDPHQANNGVVRLGNLAAGEYRVVVRKEGYRDAERTVGLKPGDKTRLPDVKLERAYGTLIVTPREAGARIRVDEAGSQTLIGSFEGSLGGLELSPGDYKVVISKEGHQPAVYPVQITAAQAFKLVPDSLKVIPPPPGPKFRPDPRTTVHAAREGKYLVFTLSGRSGETVRPIGAVEVAATLSGGGVAPHTPEGMLTGFPCQVDFVRLDNVADFSFVEPPGAGNDWRRVVVRVRPKDSKRDVRFQIIWRLLRDGPVGRP